MSDTTRSSSPSRWALRHGLFVLAVVVFVLHGAGYGEWIVDDASITFAYAQNLAEHGELANFPGGERVEGYSNPAWMLLCAALEAIGLFHPVVTPKVLAFALTVLCLGLVTAIVRRGLPDHADWLAGAFAVVLVTNTSFVAWSVSGLENPLYGAAILAALLRIVDGRLGFVTGLLLAIVATTRPEGVAYVAVLLAVAAFVPGAPSRSRAWLRTAAVVAAVVALVSIHRWIVFQDVVPNTAYAKLGARESLAERFAWDGAGVRYVREGLRAQHFDLMLGIGLLALFGARRRIALALLGVIGVGTAFAAYAGGDWMMEFRFLTPVHAAIAALFGLAIGAVATRFPRRSVVAAATVSIAVVTLLSSQAGWPRFRAAAADPTVPAERVVRTAQQARSLADAFALGHVRLVFADVGESSRWGSRNGVEVVDVARLASRVVARLGYGDASRRFLVEGWRPDVVMVHAPWSGLAALQEHPDFERLYRPVWESDLDLPVPTGFYVRRALVETDPAVVGHPIDGPTVDGLVLAGWTAVRGLEEDHVAVDLHWRALDVAARPVLRWEWAGASGELTTAHRIHDAPGGRGFLRTPLPLVQRPVGPLVLTDAAGDTLWTAATADLLATASAVPALSRAGIVSAARRAWDAADTTAALAALESVPPNRHPVPDAALRSIREDASRALLPDAGRARRTVTNSADVEAAIRRAERAMRLWPGNTEAMILLGDLLPLAGVVGEGQLDPRAAFRGLDDPSALTTRDQLVAGALRPAAAWHRWRLRDFLPRFGDAAAECSDDASVVHLGGWLGPEEWGRWAVGEVATLWLDGTAGRTFVVEASAWPAMDVPQTVEVVFEGRTVGSFTVDGEAWRATVHTFDLPDDLDCGVLRLEFARRYPDPPPGWRVRTLAVQSIGLR